MSEQNLTLFEIETKIAEAADRAVEGDEDALSVGVRVMAAAALRYLNG